VTKWCWLPLALLLVAGCRPSPSHNEAALTDSAGNVVAPETAPVPQAPTPSSVGDVTNAYVLQAGAGDLFEIESSRAILKRTKDPAIRDFAQMMVSAHTDSSAKLKQAAASAGLPPRSPALSADQRKMLDGIGAAAGSEADRAYVRAQRTAHQQALSLHQTYAASGEAPALKALAAQLAAVVQRHLDALASLPQG